MIPNTADIPISSIGDIPFLLSIFYLFSKLDLHMPCHSILQWGVDICKGFFVSLPHAAYDHRIRAGRYRATVPPGIISITN